MKIAICFSGQPRFVQECYPGIKKNILDSNKDSEIDVFVHTWFSDSIVDKVLYHNEFSSFSGDAKIEKNSIDNIKKLYNPKEITIEEPLNFQPTVDYEGSFNKQFSAFNKIGISKDEYIRMRLNSQYSSLYSIMQSNMLKRKFELNNGILYDWVVKLRFDNIIKNPIDLSLLDPTFLYHQEMGKPESEIADWINFSNSKNMDSFSSAFATLENLAEMCNSKYGWFSPESILKMVCVRDNIKLKSITLNTELPKWGKL